jgi:flagellar basal-body rod protein FlgF
LPYQHAYRLILRLFRNGSSLALTPIEAPSKLKVKNMDPLTSMAASGLRSNLESLDLIANNLANVQTNGFKKDSEFYSLYAASDAEGPDAYDSARMPVIERNWTDYSQGDLHQTGIPTDLALSGAGFFAVAGPSGPLYTRNGAFRFTPAGRLVTSDGYALLGFDRKPIQLDPAQTLHVAPDGTLVQNGAVAGRIQPVTFKAMSDLSKQGASLYRFNGPDESVAPASGLVLQGRLEGSNVDVAGSAVRMVTVMRGFEMLQKSILIGVEMNTTAIQQVAKSGA